MIARSSPHIRIPWSAARSTPPTARCPLDSPRASPTPSPPSPRTSSPRVCSKPTSRWKKKLLTTPPSPSHCSPFGRTPDPRAGCQPPATRRVHLSHLRFHRLRVHGRLLHCRFFCDLAIHPYPRLPLAALHQPSGPPYRATRRHQRIPKRRLQLLQRSHALHQSPRGPRILPALLLYLRSRHR